MPQEPPVKTAAGFEVRIPIALAEIRSWSPERSAAFFGGLAQAMAAIGRGGSILLQLPTPQRDLVTIDASQLVEALEESVIDAAGKEPIYQLRDALVQLVQDHKSRCTHSDCHEPIGFVAFLAHSVGVRSTLNLSYLRELLVQYEANCPGCTPLN